MSTTRSYRKSARARAEAATGEAILDAAYNAFSKEPFGRVTLKQIAKDSEVTVQTVIRRFGSKEDLFNHLAERESHRIIDERDVPEEQGLSAAVNTLVRHYERDGDLMINLVNQEKHVESIGNVVKKGREVHREWVEKHCGHLFAELTGTKREQQLFAAISATDLGTWKLLRRDYGLEPEMVANIITQLLNGLNGGS